MRYVGNRLDVVSDVFADTAVAARRSLNEVPILVADTHRQAVKLQLANKRRDLTIEPFDDTVGPRKQLVTVHSVVEAGHRNPMLDWRKGGADQPADLS